jgi:hypothetical protein
MPQFEGPSRITFAQMQGLWPRHPELIAGVCAKIGWRDVRPNSGAHDQTATRLVRLHLATGDGLRMSTEGPFEDNECPSRTVEEMYQMGIRFDQLTWILSRLAPTDAILKQRLCLWAADCIAHVLHFFEEAHPHDMSVRNAIVAARKFARGEIDMVESEEEALTLADRYTRRMPARLVVSGSCDLLRERDFWAASSAALSARAAVYCSVSQAEPAVEREREWQIKRLVSLMTAQNALDWPIPMITEGLTWRSNRGRRTQAKGSLPSRLKFFSGRTKELKELHRRLHKGRKNPSKPIIVSGAIGKTEFVIEYAHRYSKFYSGICFVPALSRANLVQALGNLDPYISLDFLTGKGSEDLAPTSIRNFAEHARPLLVICDNLISEDILVDLLPAHGSRLVATVNWTPIECRNELVLKDLTLAEAAELLQKAAGIDDQFAAEQIVSLEGFDPVNLWSIGHDCHVGRLSLATWLKNCEA